MRLWSLHPHYLDQKGLVALWREALLAQKVLQGATRGYRHHPQLLRFKAHAEPVAAVATYLSVIHGESRKRGYHFDVDKIDRSRTTARIPCTQGQLQYEWERLKQKLRSRDGERYRGLMGISSPEPHPLFTIVPGEVASWEVVHGHK